MDKSIKEITEEFIVNNLGINLCSVRNIYIDQQTDGQLICISIEFIPNVE